MKSLLTLLATLLACLGCQKKPITPPKLSPDILQEDHIAERMADEVTAVLPDASYAVVRKRLNELPPQWRYLFVVVNYHTKVITGGHDSYFQHTEGELIQLVEEGLRFFEDSTHADIFQRALSIYRAPDSTTEATFASVDSAYFSTKPEIPAVVEKYILAHQSQFFEQ